MRLRIAPDQEPEVRCRFLYAGPVGELQQECVWDAEGELAADFPEGLSIEFVGVADATRALEPGEEFVYVRWEPLE